LRKEDKETIMKRLFNPKSLVSLSSIMMLASAGISSAGAVAKKGVPSTRAVGASSEPILRTANQIQIRPGGRPICGGKDIILGPESFEGSFPPSGWTQFSWSESGNHWIKASPGSHGSYAAWVAYDPNYPQDEVLQTKPMDLSSYDACTLSFYFWQDYAYEDYLYIGVSIDGGGPGGTWYWLGYLYQTGANWEEVVVDLSDFCGYPNVVIGFDYYTVTPDQNSEGVDYVTVYGTPLAPEPKNWSIFVFLNGDNDLEGAGIDDVNEMEKAIDTSLYNVVVQFDRIPGYDNSNGNWTTTRIYRITPDASGDGVIRSQLISDLGERNMGDPNELAGFVNWGIDNYPAYNYAVVIWDHGSGWYKGEGYSPLFKGISQDETNSDEIGVANGEYKNAISQIYSQISGSLDLLCNDACLMGMHEVAYEVRDYVTVIVFSEHAEPADGYPYDDILNWLNTYPNATPQQFGQAIVNLYGSSYKPGGSQYCNKSVTQSCVDLARMNNLSDWIDTFAIELMKAGGKDSMADLRSITQQFGLSAHVDLYDFASRVSGDGSLPLSLRRTADSVMSAVDIAVLAEDHYSASFNVDNAHGIAIYYPTGTPDVSYANLDFEDYWPNWYKFIQGQTVSVEEDDKLGGPVIFCSPIPHGALFFSSGDMGIKLYSPDGRLAYSGQLQKGENRIPLDMGVYIWMVGPYRGKVAIR